MHKRTIIYRGSLKSCNYSCSYCPFAKHRAVPAELEKDRQNFARFCESIERRAQAFNIGAVFAAPYGEASVHHWYWEGLSRLAGLSGIDRVGMQTNLSFSVEESLKGFSHPHKLSVWATFHPEMTTVDAFVSGCRKLVHNNINVCAGAVGVPRNMQLLRELREKLPPAVYLWINKMDGLKRNYRTDEIEAFVQIDPFFEYELGNPDAAVQMCADRCFVEADGKVHTCNISKAKEVNWYEGSEEEIFEPVCGRKRCTCYLAYGGRADFPLKDIFGDYSVCRIPRKFRAVFFDLDGTLIPAYGGTEAACKGTEAAYGGTEAASKGTEAASMGTEAAYEGTEAASKGTEAASMGTEAAYEGTEAAYEGTEAVCRGTDSVCGKPEAVGRPPGIMCAGPGGSAGKRHGSGLSARVRGRLTALREVCPVFLATSMPEPDVKKRLRDDMNLFQGFIFASGGYLRLKGEHECREKIYPIDEDCLSEAIEYGKSVKAQPAVYEKNGISYKITLVKGHHSLWKDAECGRVKELLGHSGCRFFVERNCLEIVSESQNKGTGIQEICGWLDIPPEDVLAVGNDAEDNAMAKVCGTYVQVRQGEERWAEGMHYSVRHTKQG